MTSNPGLAAGPPRAHLPLPPELRDQVYSYLLDPLHVINTAKQSVGSNGQRVQLPAYGFSTEILRINKFTSSEAREALYKRNTFVTVTCTSNLEMICRRLNIPYVQVTPDQIAQFRHSSLHITVLETYGTQSTVNMIVCGQHLRDFCFAIRFMLGTLPMSSYFINGRDSIMGVGPFVGMVEIFFELKDTEYHTRCPALDRRMLEQFRECVTDDWKVSIIGSTEGVHYIQSLVSYMSPPIPSPFAREWHVFETVMTATLRAEEAYRRSDIVSALDTFQVLCCSVDNLLYGWRITSNEMA